MAVSVGTLQPLPSSSCERPNTCGSIFRQYYPRQPITKLLVHLECRICCSINSTHRSSFKKQYRQPFRSSTLEDAAITSWALYTYDNRTNQASNLPKPSSYNAESSNSDETTEVAADDQQATILVADAQGRKGRRNLRAPNPSLSISQSFDGQGNGGYIMQARGAPAAAMSKPFAGGVGLYMALVFALLGVTTAGASLLGINSSQEECTKCLGYGVERCHLCQCTGTIKYEGHFVRTIPCPLCLGSRMKKCSCCDGVRIKKGVPPFLQEKHAESSQRSNK